MLPALLLASVVAYSLATVFYLRWLLHFRVETRRMGSAFTALAVGIVAGSVVVELNAAEPFFATASPQVVLMLTAGVGGVFILMRFLKDYPIAGSVVAPLSAGAILALLLKASAPVTVASAQPMGALTAIHVSAAMLGFLLFVPSYVLSVLFLDQEHRLKTKQVSNANLPGLLALETNAWRLLMIGFPLYSVGILLGLLWQDSAGSGSAVKPQHIIAALSWCIYAVAIYRRSRDGWRGRRAALTVMAAFVTAFTAVLLYMMR